MSFPLTEFIGHFHPVLVHLPIGILLIALLLQWFSRSNPSLLPAVKICLLAGVLSAALSCLTGYLLSLDGDYDPHLIRLHMWSALTLTALSLLLYVRLTRQRADGPRRSLAVVDRLYQTLPAALLVLLTITGHFGGSLTHGSGYLTAAFEGTSTAKKTVRPPITNIQEAKVYADIIQPVLEEKCYGCHGPQKQKGRLRMDDTAALVKGGKDGKVIVAFDPAQSILFKRIGLPEEDEHHMPPKERSQLSPQEIQLIHWWIASGIPFDKKVTQLVQPDSVRLALRSLQQPAGNTPEEDPPLPPVDPANPAVIGQLQQAGITVLPVAQNSNYLEATFVNDSEVDPKSLQLLTQLKSQLLTLRLDNTNTDDPKLALIGGLTSLTNLQLSHTVISDKGLARLTSLVNLRSLNLAGTSVTGNGVLQLRTLPHLQKMYLFATPAGMHDWSMLRKAFPRTTIDSGGYIVPTLTTDTTVVKPKALPKS